MRNEPQFLNAQPYKLQTWEKSGASAVSREVLLRYSKQRTVTPLGELEWVEKIEMEEVNNWNIFNF